MARVPTGIPGFDELIEGGFIENDVILLTGGPGAGKSTFGSQYLYAGIMNHDEPGVYVTFEETPARIMRNMWRHGWDMERLIKEDKLRVIRADPIAYDRYIKKTMEPEKVGDHENATLETVLKQIYASVREIDAKRLFIDSLTSLKISSDPVHVRHIILEFIKNVESFDCTTLITSEINKDPENFSVEEYLAEGVICLKVNRIGGERIRSLEILKMRGVKHDEVLRPYIIADKGIIVYSSESVIGKEADVFSLDRCTIPGEE
ncbi:RAD55 family ATPase [Methanolobus profundi]|uniref:RecA-superfamily ATPase, KaiC/GvpD/RAD55 family n=1 Tax=Methanolobus profundi TaxID=487685 RepID=A0A1I4QWY5_9EURY|nr:ATPase domain-containing protein [Methanolobus profundi]SFM44521.1 RecA-superfamily ATPase, KaiC/GvpD/RAD55 family [Methanolobus profundi]